MTITHKVWAFPTFPITKQVFYVPGAAMEGGFTSGGARIVGPEPGGFSMLHIEPSLQITEWDYPLSSWIMSKTNGQIVRVRLAPTPQVASARSIRSTEPWHAEGGFDETVWSNLEEWSGDLAAVYNAAALQGSNVLVIDMGTIGPILQPGHVIGHAYDCYKVDEIAYVGTIATMQVTPPLRRNVTMGDSVYFRPWFTGIIANGSEIITAYDSENVGHIKLPNIILNEAIIP